MVFCLLKTAKEAFHWSLLKRKSYLNKPKIFDGTRFKNRKMAPFYGYGYLKNKKAIRYDEIKQVNIECVDNIFKEPFKRPEFKIITKDKKTHLLPVAFPEKDKDEIIKYFKEKMKKE